MYKNNTIHTYIRFFDDININDLLLVGGKNASLGEMYQSLTRKGINIPGGFAVTASAFREFILSGEIELQLQHILDSLDKNNYSNLKEVGNAARAVVLSTPIPRDIQHSIKNAYHKLSKQYGTDDTDVAVRSSATAEDLPHASFAGQHESFLNITGELQLIHAVHNCYASLFTDRAIKYREDNGFDHLKVAISVGVQKMVRSDLASSGVCFTLEPESGFRNIILITGAWGLGENVVQGTVNPDEFYLFKPSLLSGKRAMIASRLGKKEKTMVYSTGLNHEAGHTISNLDTPVEKQNQFVLNDEEAVQLGKWCQIIEDHYRKPMDIEWAKDGLTGTIFIVQARPETVHSRRNPFVLKEYHLNEKGTLITKGNAVGSGIATGIARVLKSPAEGDKLKTGEILVTDLTNPDWDPLLKKAAAIVTDKGGRTSHASIVARELGTVAVVGTENGTTAIKDGQQITVSCSEGKTGNIYDGKLSWKEKETDFRKLKMPDTRVMMILGDPGKAFKLSFYPNNGIGLMRIEFIINNSIRIHPMALVKYEELKDPVIKEEIEKLTHHYPDKKNYFIEKLAQSVALIAAAFYPKEVIVRMSDFKTNEYANLIGGKEFEPEEENPMLGFRGASRYYSDRYKEGFRLECEAMKTVREDMGFTNVKLMIPFCRTVEEGKKVIRVMEEYGLKRGVNGLAIYVMAEIPSNIILAEEFAKIFDGFSIGSNDLTQLTLGIDRDSATISGLFNENNDAVKTLIASLIQTGKKTGVKTGLCGQAPSDMPEFAQFLVEQGINSISFNPDALIKGIENINEAENKIKNKNHQSNSKTPAT